MSLRGFTTEQLQNELDFREKKRKQEIVKQIGQRMDFVRENAAEFREHFALTHSGSLCRDDQTMNSDYCLRCLLFHVGTGSWPKNTDVRLTIVHPE